MTPLINEVMLAISGSLIASILAKATGVAAAALLGTWLARKSRAAVRHVLLAAAFAVLLALPIGSLVAPPLRVEVPSAATERAVSAQLAATLETVLLIDPVESAAAVAPTAASSRPSTSTVLLAVWAMGTTLFLIPVVVGVWQMRSLRRSGLPWRHGQDVVDSMARDASIKRGVEVLLHESMAGPMTCGVFQPAIVLPVDAPAWAEADLRRAIVHELEHVRRADWATQCFARIVCASYWFHPLVWVAWRRLSLEAERACDDAVLRRAEATDYAEQLVVLAERLSIAPNRPLLAMANRHDLATRVVAVLDSRQRRGRAGARWVALACAFSGLIVATMSPLRIVAAAPAAPSSAQAPATPSATSMAITKFEVASIKPCKSEEVMPQTRSGGRGGGPGTYSTSPGRLNIPCLNVEELIRLAYVGFGAAPSERLLNNSPSQAGIKGGPAWVRSGSDKYAIEAKAEGDPDKRQMMGPMLRSLLEDRFQLKIHREREEAPMYALTVAKGGLKVQPMKDGDCNPDPPTPGPPVAGQKPHCGSLQMLGGGGIRTLTFGGTTLSEFARSLSAGMDRYVIDRTETSGQFILRLEYAQDENTPNMPFGTPVRREPAADDPPGVSILTALQEQLGLKLEPIKGPREFIVIDRVERPSPNSAP
jgi:bla regulator protein blaR1